MWRNAPSEAGTSACVQKQACKKSDLQVQQKNAWKERSNGKSHSKYEKHLNLERESYHCLMIDLNDFISSVDFLTAIGEGLEDAQRGTVISCCSISVSCH